MTNCLSCLVRASLSGHKQVLNWDSIVRVRRLLGFFRQIQVSGCQPSGLELPSPASPGLELQPISHTQFFKVQPQGSGLGRTGLRISVPCPLLSYCLDFLDWLGWGSLDRFCCCHHPGLGAPPVRSVQFSFKSRTMDCLNINSDFLKH